MKSFRKLVSSLLISLTVLCAPINKENTYALSGSDIIYNVIGTGAFLGVSVLAAIFGVGVFMVIKTFQSLPGGAKDATRNISLYEDD